MNQEKEQEMIGSVGQGDSAPKITLSEFPTSKELMEKEMDARVKSRFMHFLICVSEVGQIHFLFWLQGLDLISLMFCPLNVCVLLYPPAPDMIWLWGGWVYDVVAAAS